MKSAEIALGEVQFNRTTRTLTLAGEEIELRNKSMDILVVLAGSPGEIVTKQNLLDQVWADATINEEGLVQCIADIRRAIGDTKKRIIQTVPRKGYRLNAEEIKPRTATRMPLLITVPIVFVCMALISGYVLTGKFTQPQSPPRIAVLPLEDLSLGESKGAMGNILSEGIITDLARFSQFKVVAKNSSFKFGDGYTDARKISEVLGADYILDGSQQFDGNELRVSYHLVDARDGTHVLSGRINSLLGDIFSVQDSVVQRIASSVGISILDDIPGKRGSEDVSALMLGLKARRHMRHFSKENWEKAFALEQQSINQFPDSAWGHLGNALLLRSAASWGWLEEPKEQLLDRAEYHAQQAVTFDPDNYMAHFARARVHSEKGEMKQAIGRFEESIRLNPSDSQVLIGFSVALLYVGQNERALAILEQAKEIDPLHSDWLYWQQGWAYWQTNQCDKGVSAMTSMANPPVTSQRMLAALYACLGDKKNAQSALQVYLDKRPDYTMKDEIEKISSGQWEVPGAVERWLDDMRFAGMPHG